ncbi:Uncharacterised protein [Klebsiella pneumoniae]|nr:Uncharacterised protein [Klebsiella pneumoniae]
MAHFAPVSGYHIGGDRQPGGAAELGHHLPAGETLLGAARIFGVGQNILQPFTQRDGLIQQPGAVRVDGDARIRETLFQRPRGVNLLLAGQHAAFELKVFETVAILGGFRQTHYRLAAQRLLVAQAVPFVIARRMVQIAKVGFLPIADIEQVAQHGDGITLLTRAQQLADRHIKHLAEQVQQRRFQRRHRVNLQFEGPRPFAEGVEIRRLIAFVHLLHHAIESGDLLAHHLRDRRQQRLVDDLSAGRFADAGMAGVIG